MMKLLWIALILSGTTQCITAQSRQSIQQKKDSLRLDSLCRKNPSKCLDYGEIIGRNSVFKTLDKETIQPKSTLCFNKKFYYKATINRKNVQGCYYVNTKNGWIAKFDNPQRSCENLMEIKVGDHLEFYAMTGESFSYYINDKGYKYFYTISAPENTVRMSTTFAVKSKPDLESGNHTKLTDQNYPTLEYTIEQSSAGAVYSLFAPVFESQFFVRDYLGSFGTGYYENQHGHTMLSLALHSDQQNVIKIQKITDVAECFDGSSFESQHERINVIENQIYEERNRELVAQESAVSGDCAAKRKLVELKRDMLEKEKQATQLANRAGGRLSVRDLETLAKGNDVLNEAKKHKLELEAKACELRYSNSITTSEEVKARNNTQLTCISNSVTRINDLIISLQSIDRSRLSSASKLVSKNQEYMQKIKTINLSCRR